MSRYRKVDPRIWNDAKFGGLSDDGKLVFLLLLTHPDMTSLGAMKATPGSLAEDLGWTRQRLSKGFAEGFGKGLLEHDPAGRLVCLPNFLRYNPPENPNVLKAWFSALDLLPECRLKFLVMQRVEGLVGGMSEGFRKALPKGFREAIRKGLANQEQEQEPEQEPLARPRKGSGGTSEERGRPTSPLKVVGQ